MSTDRVLRFPREEGGFVLVQVSSRGKKPLDVDLLATENENPYFLSIRQDRISQMKADNDNIDDAAWSAAVSWTFLRKEPAAAYQQLIDRLEVAASIEKKQGLVLKFRQDIEGGIKPRIGSITLAQDDSQELDLFEWAGMLAADVSTKEQATMQLSEKVQQQGASLSKLQSQLDEFINLKNQDEEQLLEKFRQLLNTKKLKIRDQQRLLAGATVDPSVAERLANQRQAKNRANGGTRGSNKRKIPPSVENDEEQVGDETMDRAATESEDDFEAMDTPERSDSEEVEPKEELASPATAPQHSIDARLPSRPVAANDVVEGSQEAGAEGEETDDEL